MLYRLAVALLLSHLPFLPAWADPASPGANWAQIGVEARERGLPVVVLVTEHDCGFCERMRRDFLSVADTRAMLDERAVLGEIPRDQGGKITDFDGERIRARVFLSRYEIFATPTALFVSPSGEPLAPPLVGYNDQETYAHLVSERLEHAGAVLETGERMTRAALAGAQP